MRQVYGNLNRLYVAYSRGCLCEKRWLTAGYARVMDQGYGISGRGYGVQVKMKESITKGYGTGVWKYWDPLWNYYARYM